VNKKLTEYVKKIRALGEGAAYVGRLNPMHLGHQALIEVLVEAFPENHLILVGSCSHPVSIRHLFKFSDRARFISKVFPSARIAPLPDFDNDEEWFHAMDKIMCAAGMDPSKTVFIGGCEEDVSFYHGRGFIVEIINRFGGVTKNVSGTEVRDTLIQGRSLRSLLDPRIISDVKETFRLRWSEVKQK
jgi:nicotinic acid mononucleotide adenylyltransferase